MPAPFSILTLDLHNTLYDEVLEYGLAIDEAVTLWMEECKRRQPIARETLYHELSVAHLRRGSDWDGEVWRDLPSLARLSFSELEFNKIMLAAETCRRKKSRELTLSGLYEGIQETLATLKSRGVRIYVMTEATAEVAMNAIVWLKLAGVVDGVYSYPSRMAPQPMRGTFHKSFPATEGGSHIKKPHAMLIAALVLDEAIRRGEVPDGTRLADIFTIASDDALLIPELGENSALQGDASSRLVISDTPYASAVMKVLGNILYVGDSKFKDGLLARNAGVAFGHAAYGKKVKPGDAARQKQSLDIMYAVSGWDKDVMKLTQEASKSAVIDNLQPDYSFENSLSESLGLFIGT